MITLRKLIILLTAWIGFCCAPLECANILAVVPYNARSHFIVMEPLFKGLARIGHNVTVASTFPQKEPIERYTDVDLNYVLPTYVNTFTLDFIRKNLNTPWKSAKVISNIGDNMCVKLYNDKMFQKFLNSTDVKYDLLITEIFASDCFTPFAHKLNIPIVSIVTSVSLPWVNDRIGNPDSPSYIPNYFMSTGDQMSFFERLTNFVLLNYLKLQYYYDNEVPSNKLAKKYFGEDLPPINEIISQRTSLILVNSYFTVNQPRPFVPGVVEIGGIHLGNPKTLPKEIESVLDKADNGFIYFSLGSLFKGSSMDKHVIDAFLKSFAKLKHTVIWKFESEIKNLPPNVIVRKWWPQREILLHRNIRLFITHGGLSSIIEAVSSGVPVIGIPLFADQSGNVNNIVRRGAGIALEYDNISLQSLSESINQIINNESYMINSKEMSRRFNDRPLPPLENALFWVEYVLRHNGAYFMHSAGTDLPIYKYYCLDVIFFILVVCFVFLHIIYKVIKFIFRSFFHTNSKNYTIKNKVKRQ